MSDSQRLHANFLSILQSNLADEDFRNLDTLAWALTGALLQRTIHLPDWASGLPETSDAASRERRFRRWLNNSTINVRRFYQPFITQALASWSGHTLYLAIDTTSIANHLVIARTAVIYRGRAVPLAWQVFKRQSVMLNFEQYAGLVRYTARLLPRGVIVVLLGDRGFRDVRLMALPRQLHWHFRLRLAENEYVWSGLRQRAHLDRWQLVPHQPRFLQAVRLTAQRYGPVNLALGWDGDPTHDPWRIASDQPACLQTFADYARRMGIDLGFLDDKSAGFQLQDTELLSPRRLTRLLLVLALCNLYLVSLGTEVVATGQRRLVDAHWQRGLSYLHLGWRWLDQSLARELPLSMRFHLDPAPDPEPFVPTAPESAEARWELPT
jgi:hypothetical protein